jgi:hypothetical protein
LQQYPREDAIAVEAGQVGLAGATATDDRFPFVIAMLRRQFIPLS